MKADQLATLVLRLMGIYFLIQAIPVISVVPSAVSIAAAPSVDGKERTLSSITLIVGVALPYALRLIIGVLLLKQSVPWGRKLAGQSSSEVTLASVTFEQVQVFGFAVLGILVFASALPQFFKNIVFVAQALADESIYGPLRWREGAGAVGAIAEASLGLALFLRPGWFVNFCGSQQPVGTPESA